MTGRSGLTVVPDGEATEDAGAPPAGEQGGTIAADTADAPAPEAPAAVLESERAYLKHLIDQRAAADEGLRKAQTIATGTQWAYTGYMGHLTERYGLAPGDNIDAATGAIARAGA